MCPKLTQCGTILNGYADEQPNAENQNWFTLFSCILLCSFPTITKFDTYFRKIKHQIIYLNITTVPKIAWRGLWKDTDGQEANFMPNLIYLKGEWLLNPQWKVVLTQVSLRWTVWFRKTLQSDSKTRVEQNCPSFLFWVGIKLASISNSRFQNEYMSFYY